ncbi:unnamed protein product [Cuscuta campestris]|uniref:Uncharacterized protein n=1 Tax=Cuscuta campestris TaxID=132261 RepID=A0A484LTB3_9ASTE|nr:unnamed protein product [Cuscuta campestris]
MAGDLGIRFQLVPPAGLFLTPPSCFAVTAAHEKKDPCFAVTVHSQIVAGRHRRENPRSVCSSSSIKG